MPDKKDHLALVRSSLANERTFLAYFRTSIVFMGTGLAIFKLKMLTEIQIVGYFLLVVAPLMLIFGIVRYFLTKRKLKKLMEE